MRFDYAVKIGGVYYPANTEIPENIKKKSKGKEQKENPDPDKGKEQKENPDPDKGSVENG